MSEGWVWIKNMSMNQIDEYGHGLRRWVWVRKISIVEEESVNEGDVHRWKRWVWGGFYKKWERKWWNPLLFLVAKTIKGLENL